ncbi:MAG: YopX family protein [Crocinitomicaceae bacterium]
MNREIKFRAWDIVGLKMIQDFIKVNEEGHFISHHEHNTEHIPMQFTGLNDKNGKDIYEGDIVNILYTDWPSKSISDSRTLEQYLTDISSVGVVKYNKNRFEIEMFSTKYSENYFSSIDYGKHGFIKVVGNIYENPELMEVGSNAV